MGIVFILFVYFDLYLLSMSSSFLFHFEPIQQTKPINTFFMFFFFFFSIFFFFFQFLFISRATKHLQLLLFSFPKTVEAMRGCLDKEFVLKQKDTTVDDVRRALESCARAAKPREPMVLHSLRRAMYLMSQSMSNIILLRPLIRALSIRDTETAKVAGGMLLILEFSPPITATWSEMLYCSDRGTKR